MTKATLIFVAVVQLSLPLTALAQEVAFENPLRHGNVHDLGDLLNNIIRWMTGIVGLVALLALIWGGILYIISFNNDQYLNNAKSIIKWAIIGLSIVMLSFVIIQTVAQFLGT